MRSNMRRTYRTRGRSRGADRSNFWLSFSDLMSALVLVIILVLFYILYKYFIIVDDYQARQVDLVALEQSLIQSQANIESQSALLLEAQEELSNKEDELAIAQSALTTAQEDLAVKQILLVAAQDSVTRAQEELTVQNQQLLDAQSALAIQQQQITTQQEQLTQQQEEMNLQNQQLVDAQNALTIQQQQIETQQQQLVTQQQLLATQQEQLVTQQQQLTAQQEEIEQLVGVRTRIISSLSTALRNADISATVDPMNGSIALASDVLFETGKSDLSRQGKRRIDQFLPVYLEVLFSEEYAPFVSEIIIEGHTDSRGGYIDNLALSQARAFAVASYVLDDDYHAINETTRTHLRSIVTANGRSYADLIYVNGKEDQDASRRVVFKFRLTDEQMVSQLQEILEQSAPEVVYAESEYAGTSFAEELSSFSLAPAPRND